MNVSDEEWIKAFAMTYARKYLTYHETGVHPFTNLSTSNVLTQTFWVGRTQARLAVLPSNNTTQAVRRLLDGFSQLKLTASVDEKFKFLRELLQQLKEDSDEPSQLAATALQQCL